MGTRESGKDVSTTPAAASEPQHAQGVKWMPRLYQGTWQEVATLPRAQCLRLFGCDWVDGDMGVFSQEKLERDQMGLDPGKVCTLKTAGGGLGEPLPVLVAPPSVEALATMPPEEAERQIWEALAINADMVGSEVSNRMLGFLMRLDKFLLRRIVKDPVLLIKALELVRPLNPVELIQEVFAGNLMKGGIAAREDVSCHLLSTPGIDAEALLYHETQVRLHCAVHATNDLLQGPFFLGTTLPHHRG